MTRFSSEQLDQWMTAACESEDRDSYQEIVRACHHLVRSVILRETADPELADEIAQEVFVRGWLHRNQYRPGTNPRSWLLAIARSQLVEYHRRQSRDNRHLRDLVRRELLRRGDQSSSKEEYFTDNHKAALAACLAKLNEEQHELLELVHGQGLGTADAADILGIQPTTCRQRISRLQRSLRQCAEEEMKAL